MSNFNLKKFTAKVLLFTEDGENFLVINQFYLQDLIRGCKVDGAPLQGMRFRLIEDKNEQRGE